MVEDNIPVLKYASFSSICELCLVEQLEIVYWIDITLIVNKFVKIGANSHWPKFQISMLFENMFLLIFILLNNSR